MKTPAALFTPILKRLFDFDKKSRKRFMDQGNEIARYGWAPDFSFEYQTLPRGAFFKAKAAKTSEAIKVFGPYLYQNNPHRTISVKPWSDQFTAQKAQLLEDYQNYSIGEYDYFTNSRAVIDDGISWGRGVKWTKRDDSRDDLIVSEHDSVRNLLVDGDVTKIEKCRRVWRRCIRNRSEMIADYSEAQAAITRLPKATKRWSPELLIPGEDNNLSGDGVEYWEMWSKDPLTIFEGGKELAQIPGTDGPLHYLVDAEGNYLWHDQWEIPLYLDDTFPCTVLDFYAYPSSPWPVSPLQDGIGYQRAINWLITLIMGKYRFTSRTSFVLMNQNEQGLGDVDRDKVLVGADIEALSVKVNGEMKNINDFAQQLNWDNSWIAASIELLNLYEDRYEKATGLYNILYSGQTGTQARSATASTVMDRNSQSRINLMRDQTIRFERDVARKEGLCARYLLDRNQIAQCLGPQAGQQWGFLVKPDNADGQQWVQQFMQSGMDQQSAMQLAQQKLSEAVDINQWARETEYDIEPDSMQKPNVDTQIAAYKEMANQLIPTLVSSPLPQFQAIGFELESNYLDLIGSSKDTVKQVRGLAEMLRSQPPPPPAQPIATAQQ